MFDVSNMGQVGGVSFRSRVPEDDPLTVDILNRLSPEYPQLTVEEFRQTLDSFPPTVSLHRLSAVKDGNLVGFAVAFQMFWLEAPGAYTIQLAVDPNHWDKGIGSRLYDWAFERAKASGARRIYAEVREDRPNGIEFAKHRGYTETGHTARMSALDVYAAVLDGCAGLEEQLAESGIRISTLAELGPSEDMLRSVYEVMNRSSRDVPSSETIGMSYDVWRDTMLAMPGTSYETSWIALDHDKPVGMAFLQRRGAHAAFNGYTGVDRDYRGRGVARALKHATILWARKNGVDLIVTGNDIDNERMLTINRRLGYRPLPSSLEVVKKI